MQLIVGADCQFLVRIVLKSLFHFPFMLVSQKNSWGNSRRKSILFHRDKPANLFLRKWKLFNYTDRFECRWKRHIVAYN